MKALPSLIRLFLNRFIPASLVYISSMLFLFEVDEHAHKTFLTQIGVRSDDQFLGQLHAHLLSSLVPVGLLLFIAMSAVCLLFAIKRRQQLASDARQQEHLYKIQLLLDSTQEGIYGTDHHGCCTMANKACARMLGFDSPEQLLGQQMHNLMHHTRPDGSHYPAEECTAHRMSETGVVNVIENELFWRRDGSSFPVSYSVLPMRDGQQAVGMVCSFMDITEKLQIEEQLRQAQKMEAVGQLSGGIAHDFNNILQIVSNNTRLAMERFDADDPVYTSLQEMITAVERGSNLTRSMLAFSRKQFMRMKPLELNRMLADALILGRKLLPKTVQLEFIPCEEPLHITADSTLLQQVLFNLLTNARDAMPAGGTITVITKLVLIPDQELLLLHNSSHHGPFARLMVTDQGGGIPEEIRQKIFDPFFTTKEVGQGTGLGLSMAFGTLQQHGGFVSIASSSEKGTTIAVCLPIQEPGSA
ncbi:MAG: ATP-binding protein [Geobacteraceae bacterium]|nr:ATP-binding protein [Geobacteraceae bacterium]